MAVHRPRLWLIAIAAIAALVLALGLGLGLGLKHSNSIQSVDPAPAAATASPTATSTSPSLQSQPGSNFVLTSLLNQPPQTRAFNFTLGLVQGAPDGFSRPMLAVNGIYPGPVIQANQADRLVITVHNTLPNASSIHWHGLFQNGTNFYDGTSGVTECGIPPGQSLTYKRVSNFTRAAMEVDVHPPFIHSFTFGEFSGTTWWHFVSSPDSSTQYTDGISGPLIVHPTAPPPGLPAWDEELVIQMADWYHDMSGVLLAQYLSPSGIQGTPGNEPVPDAGTINGFGQYAAAGTGGSYFNLTLQRNKTYRIRLTNTGSFPSIRFSVDAHPLTLIEADGTLLAPRTVAGVTVAVAQRYSVLLYANASATPSGTYWMRATVRSDMFRYSQPGQNLDIRGIFIYADAPSSSVLPGPTNSPDPGPGVQGLPDVDGKSSLVPLVPDPAPEATRPYPLSVSFQNTNNGQVLGFMNSTSWSQHSGGSTLLAVRKNPGGFAGEGSTIAIGDQLLVTEDSIQVIQLQVDNLDDGDHPFHLHGHRPWIVGTGDGRYTNQALNITNPLRRDTVLIPAFSWLVLRFVTDNPGVWAFHCHLAWHMAAGLLMQFNSLPSAQLALPQDIVDQCSSS